MIGNAKKREKILTGCIIFSNGTRGLDKPLETGMPIRQDLARFIPVQKCP